MKHEGEQAADELQPDVGTCPVCGRVGLLYRANLQAYDWSASLYPLPAGGRRVVVLICPECRSNSSQLGIMLGEDVFISRHKALKAKAEVLRVN